MTALVLKLIACLSMLLDHIGYCWPALLPLRAAGRLAFPLFVFLMVQGFRHTSSRARYALRLGVFAVLSQIPFGLMTADQLFVLRGNVLFTLLIDLLLLWQLDELRKRGLHALGLVLPLAVFVLCWRDILRLDYGGRGILLSLSFYYLADRPPALFAGMVLSIFHPLLLSWAGTAVRLLLGQKDVFARPTEWDVYQLYGLLSFGLIRSYNGRPGLTPASRPGRKAAQLGFYAFYPLHMLALWLVRKGI